MTKHAVLLALTFLLFSFTIKDDGVQRAYYECRETLEVDKNLFDVQEGKTYFSFHQERKPVDLESKGFLWLEDKPKGYFTAYLINTSDSTFRAEKQDGSLIMIQEALNEKGEWTPIEYWVYSGCGNSYYSSLILEPGKYVMIPIKEYKGSYKTKIRLKMKKGKTLFYSDAFEGSINKSQFRKEEKKVQGILYYGPADYLE